MPNSYIYVEYIDVDDNYIDYQELPLDIISKPSWLTNYGTISNVVQDGDNVSMNAEMSIISIVENNMPHDIPGLKDKSFDISNSKIKISLIYDCLTGISDITSASLNFDLNVLDQQNFTYSYPVELTGIILDTNFNFAINTTGQYNVGEFNINLPAFRFMVGPIPIKIDGGVKFSGVLSGRLVFGFNELEDAWGFIEINDVATNITASLLGEGYLRAKADVLIASASGSIIVRGSIGGGFEYRTFAAEPITPIFGGNIQIAGAVDYKLGIGPFSRKGRFETTFYNNSWGDPLKSEFLFDNVDAFGNYARTIKRNPSFEVADFFPQAVFSTNGDYFYTSWLELNENGKQNLLLSSLNYDVGEFSSPMTVLEDKETVSNPQLAVLPSGSCLIVWSENRYTSSTFDEETMDLQDILQAQDIWATIYDIETGSFLTPFMLSDDTTSYSSGRAEGQATITMGSGNTGLITWVVKDLATGMSEIWYTTISETADYWTFGEAEKLSNLTGTNRAVNVSYFDDNSAIATWINDPDGDENTLDNKVVYKIWDGTDWSAAYILVDNDGTSYYEDLSTAFNEYYGAVAVTATDYNDDGSFEKSIIASTWDNQNDQWADLFYDWDTSYYFQQPNVSVSQDGIVALSYQAIELFTDTINPDNGTLYLFLNNSETNPANWVEIEGSDYLGNDDTYAWDLTSSFGNTNTLFVMTQEADDITGQAPLDPSYGVRFGNLDLNLVLRAFDINDDLSITDVEEPETDNTETIKEQRFFDFRISELYPNPFDNLITIKYSVNKTSHVKIEIYNILGRKVAVLVDNDLKVGIYQTNFVPNNLASGVYFCKMTVNEQTITKKMIKK